VVLAGPMGLMGVVGVSVIPVIDVSAALTGSSLGAVAEQVDRACQDVGFLQVVGHGVPLDLIDAVYGAAPQLWDLPQERKEPLRSSSDHPFHGWYTMDDDDGVALMEKWEFNNVDSPDDALARGIDESYIDHFHPNIWPTEVPELIDAARSCFDAERRLGGQLMGIFAVALGLEEDHFAPFYLDDTSYFAVNHYPGRSHRGPGEVALFEHADSGTLTILHQRGTYEGLEVLLPSGERHRVPIVDEALVVNLGTLMARWTNDRWKATRHRVLMGEPGQSRTSITTFHTPSIDARIEPIAACVGAEGTTYEALTYYEWEPIFRELTRT
jgi:isopenicillin N synthase-like dioxygenase